MPCMLAPEVLAVLEAVPEFVDRYLDLVEVADGDPGMAATFSELADFVAMLIAQPEIPTEILSRCLFALERVASESDEAEEVVGGAFLDCLSPEDRERIEALFGPCTLALAQAWR
jgi:hypothetical protein